MEVGEKRSVEINRKGTHYLTFETNNICINWECVFSNLINLL